MMKTLLPSIVFFLVAACSAHPKEPSPPPPRDDHQVEAPPGDPAPSVTCVPSGCSGTVCVEQGKDVFTTCEYRPEFECYKTATCEWQASGGCAWTQSTELQACLANGGP